MRDVDRIEKILHVLETIWRDNPDLRLGQIITNAVPPDAFDLYYIDDQTVLQGLEYFKSQLDV